MGGPDHDSNVSVAGASDTFARYRVPQRVAAISGSVVIKNDRGVATFEIDCGTQSTDDIIRVTELSGPGVCSIRESRLHPGEALEIATEEEITLATVVRVGLSPVRDQLSVHFAAEGDWTVEGLVADYEYWIRDQRTEIAHISRRWFRARDSYGIQVATGHNALLVLCVTICLDMLLDNGR